MYFLPIDMYLYKYISIISNMYVLYMIMNMLIVLTARSRAACNFGGLTLENRKKWKTFINLLAHSLAGCDFGGLHFKS